MLACHRKHDRISAGEHVLGRQHSKQFAALYLLVHKTVLVEVERGTYRVDLEIYTVDDLVRETVNSERARLIWSTNTFQAARVTS